MADAAVTFLLENVKQLLKYYHDLISGAENELEELKEDLELLDATLQKIEDMPNKHRAFMVLERQIREVVHYAEDTIDKCLIKRLEPAAAPKPKWFDFIRGSCHDIKRTVSLAEEVKYVRDHKVKPKLEKAEKYSKMGDGSGRGARESWTAEKREELIREDNVVGFEGREEVIVNNLKEKNKKLDVISITGMPGVGKTTLAWKIFQNEEIQREFQFPIWVHVSQDYNLRDVFQTILKAFTKQEMAGWSTHDLMRTVRGYLSDVKFLLVLDDVWQEKAWKEIEKALPKNNWMGKVLITSREFGIGKIASGTREPHQVGILDKNKSWELLQLEVFGEVGVCPEDLQKIGKVIAEQCNGFPLSLVVIGGILAKRYSQKQAIAEIQTAWENVSANLNKHVRKDKEQDPTNMVALSHKKLPRHLRNCFLYLGMFPADYEIPVSTLTRLWIAEGFIQLKEGQENLEEIAKENLEDLINMNLVTVGRKSPTGEVKTCRVHDVIHEFCKSKARVQDQNLFLQIHKFDGVSKPLASEIEKCRRLCVHSHVNNFLGEFQIGNLKAPLVRSFLCFCKDTNVEFHPKYLSTIPEAFTLLRVLDSKSMKFNQVPPNVAQLIHLRYITLSADNLNILPADLSSLQMLQTLVVDTKSRTLEVKTNIWNMIQLRHLKTKAEIILQDNEEGRGGENLLTLSRLSPKCCTEDVFKKAHNLKRLGIRGDLGNLLENEKSFGVLDCLETLKLRHDLPYQSTSDKPLCRFPLSKFFVQTIKSLTLSATHLEWKLMRTLAMIGGNLGVLKLKDNAFVGKTWNVTGDGFPCLEFLLIENTNLVIWEEAPFSNYHFPKLWCLVLKNCEQLKTIPVELAKSLEMLQIDNVPEDAVNSAEKIKEEKERTQGRVGGMKLEIGPGCKKSPVDQAHE